MPTPYRLIVALVVSLLFLYCSGSTVRSPQDQPVAKPREVTEPTLLARPLSAEQLVFPPVEEARWRPRAAANWAGPAPSALAVTDPSSEFYVYGQRFSVSFNQPVAGAEAGKAAGGALVISPAVRGLARWRSDRELEFVAAEPFDPETRYRVALKGVAARAGGRLDPDWQAEFKASGPELGGKLLGYLPKPGDARVVSLSVSDGQRVSPRPRLLVLYDQPVQLELVRRRVELVQKNGEAVPVRVRHAANGIINGVSVPSSHLVVVEAVASLARGDELVLRALDANPAAERPGISAKVQVAPELAERVVACDYSGTPCERNQGRVLVDQRRLHLVFNNDLSERSVGLSHKVRVTPAVPNLRAEVYNWGQGGQLIVHGDFQPATSYRLFVQGLSDTYGGKLARPIALELRQRPLAASVSMAEGALWPSERQLQEFQLTSRNVERAQLWIWQLDAQAYQAAMTHPAGATLGTPFSVLSIDIEPRLDRFVHTRVDLSRALRPHQGYLVELRHEHAAFDAKPMQHPGQSAARTPPRAFVMPGGPDGLAVHVHNGPDATLVHVSESGTGKAVPHAEVRWGDADESLAVKTNGQGLARLPAPTNSARAVVHIKAGTRALVVPAGQASGDARRLFPELALDTARSARYRVHFQTDRGIYRPGETLHVKASVFERLPQGLSPADEALTLSIKGPDGEELARKTERPSSTGGLTFDFAVPQNARLGSYTLVVGKGQEAIDSETLRVAAFQAPKFVVDIQAPKALDEPQLTAVLGARYLFGAPLTSAQVNWVLSAEPAQVPAGPLSRAGLGFEPEQTFTPSSAPPQRWTRSGWGSLGEHGKLTIHQTLPLAEVETPQKLSLQAEVSDESYRAQAARHEIVLHPAQRYAGVGLARSWYTLGEAFEAKLGVADQQGQPVVGARVEAVLEAVRYRHVKQRAAGGAVHYRWQVERQEVDRCSVVSAYEPKACSLKPVQGGRYLVSARTQGRVGGSRSVWVVGRGATAEAVGPTEARQVKLVADKRAYAPGERARLLVENPLGPATLLVTLEGDRLYEHRMLEVDTGVATLELPLAAQHAPFVHATATLLPRGSTGVARAPLRGALRLPVELSDARLELKLEADKRQYRPKERARIELALSHHGKPKRDAEIALAVVDEGVLRLTGFHAPDPLERLWQGAPLRFTSSDTRSDFAEWLHQSHVAGDGGGDAGSESFVTRKHFVHTALWKPRLLPDANGRVEVELELPDNLTEFRMLAVAIDRQGRGDTAEASFSVTQPVLLQPALPRFAKQGDQFEVAALLHNTSDSAFHGSVEIAGARRSVSIQPKQRLRVAELMQPSTSGKKPLTLTLRDTSGKIVDRVEQTLAVAEHGSPHKPRLLGSFMGQQAISLRIPEDARATPEAQLTLIVGENLYPELGEQLEFLMGYPHGCVEQTTSGTLPLIAARQILPLIGVTFRPQAFFDARIRHGLKRLDAMRTPSGGLAYWPGEEEPSVFGTAYAMRAVVGSKKLGIELPDGLESSMLEYLRQELFNPKVVPEVRSAIALSLAESERLSDGDADALFDLKATLDVFGKANIALALSRLPAQADRIDELVDEIEKALQTGAELGRDNREDLHGFSSESRALAQASLALQQLRPSSKELAPSVRRLLLLDEGYTTQATAYRLLALAEHVRAERSDPARPTVTLDGKELAPVRELPGGTREYGIALRELTGKDRTLRLASTSKRQVTFALRADYTRPMSALGDAVENGAITGKNGVDLYRVFTTPGGEPIDLGAIKAGDLVRVALLARKPSDLDQGAFKYLAISDSLPAGFEPVDTSLDTVAQVPPVTASHPFYENLVSSHIGPDYVELGDEQVYIYFDQPPGAEVAASYLVRATTPGRFALPRASAELMYEPDSTSFSEAGEVRVQ